jgi:NAD(P)H-dependent FMN reductase
MSLSIAIVCGSVRQDRRSILAANYIARQVEAAGHTAVLVDFTKLPLPFVDTPIPPGDLAGAYPYPEVMEWSKIAAAADGFIFVAPEYNHGYSAIMKNALDWLYMEFHHKPAGLVGVSDGKVGGARVIEQLRAICGSFAMYDIKETVMFREIQKVIDESGALIDPSYEKQVNKLIASLAKTAAVMQPLRK